MNKRDMGVLFIVITIAVILGAVCGKLLLDNII